MFENDKLSVSQKKSDLSKSDQSQQAPLSRDSHPAAIVQRAAIAPSAMSSSDIVQLQKTIGNQAVSQLMSSKPVQRAKFHEEEEPLQGKFPEEEEPLQGKFPEEEEPLQGKFPEEEEPLQGKFPEEEEPLQAKENNTGLPDRLKSGVETLSGNSMDDVQVHYNSNNPAQLNALAYTQGTDIHVAPRQERHLPHEAWHTVQQAQGRVQPTVQAGGVPINDDNTLEHEADVMGSKALQMAEDKRQR
jgi:hypothetical protein